MANSENTDSPETSETTAVERKTWQFGHFQTKHDGSKWRLVRTNDIYGFTFGRDVGKVVASNKSATPLVALAREMSRVEKRDIRRRRVLNQIADLRETVAVIDAEIAAEAAPIVEAA